MSSIKSLVVRNKSTITKKMLQDRLPHKRNTITDEVVNLINNANNNPDFNGDEFFDLVIEYSDIFNRSDNDIKQYIKALKFCAYLESTDFNSTEAYIRAAGTEDYVLNRKDKPKDSKEWRELVSMASRFRKTKLVKSILTQADMPLHLLFQGERYKAVVQLSKEIVGAKLSKDRIAAINTMLTHVKPPENLQVAEGVTTNSNSDIIDKFQETIAGLVKLQKQQIIDGEDLGKVTNIEFKKD